MKKEENKQIKKITCLACGETNLQYWTTAKDNEYLTTEDAFDYYKCNNCEALSIDPVPSNQLQTIYPSNYYSFRPKSENNFLLSWSNLIKEKLDAVFFKKILKRMTGKSLSILDVGGGVGWMLNIIKKCDKRIKYTAVVDIDPESGGMAKSMGHDYYCSRIEEFEIDKKYDFILLLNIIEHVEDPTLVLKKIKKILSSSGVVIIKTPNYKSIDESIFRKINWGGYHCPRHWVLFTKSSFEKLVQKAGLRIDSFSYTQGAPFWTCSLLFWFHRQGWVSITKERPVVSHPLYPLLSSCFAIIDYIRKPFSKTSQMFFVIKH